MHLHPYILHNNDISIVQLPNGITLTSGLTFLCQTGLLLLQYIYKNPALYRAFNKNLMPVISTSTLASFIKMPDCSLCAKATPP